MVAVLALVCACSSSSSQERRTLTVFAAASLTAAFTEVGPAFEDAHPQVRVELSFAGSQTLASQVRQGAPASVLATADLATLQSVAGELRGAPVVFAHNQLALITAPGNPLRLLTLADLARPGLTVVLAAPTVPAGRAAATALRAAGVTVRPGSLEEAVTGVVTKVRLGEADAGIAYATDLMGTGLGGQVLPGTTTDLAVAALAGAPAPDDADLFVAFLLSPRGRQVLRAHGLR